VFIILQIIKNKANHHPTRHHAENCINSLAPSVGNDKLFLANKKKIQNGDLRSYQIMSPIKRNRFTQIYAYIQ